MDFDNTTVKRVDIIADDDDGVLSCAEPAVSGISSQRATGNSLLSVSAGGSSNHNEIDDDAPDRPSWSRWSLGLAPELRFRYFWETAAPLTLSSCAALLLCFGIVAWNAPYLHNMDDSYLSNGRVLAVGLLFFSVTVLFPTLANIHRNHRRFVRASRITGQPRRFWKQVEITQKTHGTAIVTGEVEGIFQVVATEKKVQQGLRDMTDERAICGPEPYDPIFAISGNELLWLDKLSHAKAAEVEREEDEKRELLASRAKIILWAEMCLLTALWGVPPICALLTFGKANMNSFLFPLFFLVITASLHQLLRVFGGKGTVFDTYRATAGSAIVYLIICYFSVTRTVVLSELETVLLSLCPLCCLKNSHRVGVGAVVGAVLLTIVILAPIAVFVPDCLKLVVTGP